MAIPNFAAQRSIVGMSAILLPFQHGGISWADFERHLNRTWESNLIPAVNMDTGFANLIDESTRIAVLDRTQQLAAGRPFVAGAFVHDSPGDALKLDAYRSQLTEIVSRAGLPILFQSYGLTGRNDTEVVQSYESITRDIDKFLAFELGEMFAPFGQIYTLSVFEQIVRLPNCIGLKHSSLDRTLEFARLNSVKKIRPEFQLLTGNDLAIDMAFYGSDYLLGLSTFAPDLFALRDRLWHDGDPRAIQLNDVLQYLGFFAFRDPVPAYKHSAAQFLRLRGWIACDETMPGSPSRPDTDISVLRLILQQLQPFIDLVNS